MKKKEKRVTIHILIFPFFVCAVTELKDSFKNQPVYALPDNYIKCNAEKRVSIVSLNPCLLEKNEVLRSNPTPLKSHSTANLVETLEKRLEGERGQDNLAFAMEKGKSMEKVPLEKRLSIQVSCT